MTILIAARYLAILAAATAAQAAEFTADRAAALWRAVRNRECPCAFCRGHRHFVARGGGQAAVTRHADRRQTDDRCR